jgi:hypothetical protein
VQYGDCVIVGGFNDADSGVGVAMNDVEFKPVVVNAEPAPRERSSSVWDWIKFYAYNLWRRPLVRQKQRKLLTLVSCVKRDLSTDLLPYLWENRTTCRECADLYMILKPQVFMSQIERILRTAPYHENSNRVEAFYQAHMGMFEESENISAWINGFL